MRAAFLAILLAILADEAACAYEKATYQSMKVLQGSRSRALKERSHEQPGRRVDPDPVKWPGGFYYLPLNHPSIPSDIHYKANCSCHDMGARSQPPMSDLHATALQRKRRHPPRALPGGGPRAFFRWEGNITREQFDAVPSTLQGPMCICCMPVVRYQIISGHVYREHSGMALKSSIAWLQEATEASLLAAVYFFDIPDMDVIVHFGDACPPNGQAVLTWDVCRDRPQAGFTIPSYTAWTKALSRTQMKVYHECLNARYPTSRREKKVLWRGSNTDPHTYDFPDLSTINKTVRLRLHANYVNDSEIDAKLVSFKGAIDKEVKKYLLKAQPLAPRLHIEDFNKAAAILDVEGYAWSDRLSITVHFPTPILKQASNFTAFFEHLLVPGQLIEYIEHDIHDLKASATSLLHEWESSPQRLMESIRRRQALASYVLNGDALIEAVAYALVQYKQRCTWETKRNVNYTYIPFRHACDHQYFLPGEICDQLAKIREGEIYTEASGSLP